MLTKKQFCNYIIKDNADMLGRNPVEADIFTSSSLAVAMEHLGLITGLQEGSYAASRAGTQILFYDEESKTSVYLTTRELLNLLPD